MLSPLYEEQNKKYFSSGITVLAANTSFKIWTLSISTSWLGY